MAAEGESSGTWSPIVLFDVVALGALVVVVMTIFAGALGVERTNSSHATS
jgi:hypothetical protein